VYICLCVYEYTQKEVKDVVAFVGDAEMHRHMERESSQVRKRSINVGENLDVESFGHVRHGANPGNEEQEDACVRLGDDLRTAVERHQH